MIVSPVPSASRADEIQFQAEQKEVGADSKRRPSAGAGDRDGDVTMNPVLEQQREISDWCETGGNFSAPAAESKAGSKPAKLAPIFNRSSSSSSSSTSSSSNSRGKAAMDLSV